MKQISWSEYLSFILFILTAYYIFVLLTYYRKDLQQFIQCRFADLNSLTKQTSDNKATSSTVYINDSISQLLRKASSSSYAKEEIIFALQRLLSSADYNELNQPSYRNSINQFITEECNKDCSIHLSEEDLHVLWI